MIVSRRTLVLALGLLPVAGCDDADEHPLQTPFADPAARAAITAIAAAHGWRVAEIHPDRVPFEQHAGDGMRTHGGELMVLVGPTPISLTGYYCNNQACETPVQAHEAIELWVLPRFYPDGTNGFALQATRVPEHVFQSDRLRVYGLVSRWWPDGRFDRSFTDASDETSSLGKAGVDLPVSWTTWKADLTQALNSL